MMFLRSRVQMLSRLQRVVGFAPKSHLRRRRSSRRRLFLCAQATSGDQTNHGRHTSVGQPQYVVLHGVAIECRPSDHVIQDDPGSHVVDTVYDDGA
jgi:hypothetical protein